jgi:hypothetical protein
MHRNFSENPGFFVELNQIKSTEKFSSVSSLVGSLKKNFIYAWSTSFSDGLKVFCEKCANK